MKHVFIYANIANNGKAEYDPKTGECKYFPVKETVKNEDITAMELLKRTIEKNPGESFTFVLNRNLAVPTFQAMKVVNMVILQKYSEDDMETVEEYISNLQEAGIDPTKINLQDKAAVKALVKAAMKNTWLDEEALDYMLDLVMGSNEHKFLNIDTICAEPKEGVTLSKVSEHVRTIALNLVENRCAIPEIASIEVSDEDEEEQAE